MALAYFKYLLSLLIFGTNGIVANHISLSSRQIVFMRTLIGGLFLGLVFFLSKGRLRALSDRRCLLFLLGSGVCMGTSWMCLFEAYRLVGVSVATLIYYCGPALVLLASPLVFHERLTLFKVLGIVLALAGMTLVGGVNLQQEGLSSGLLYAVLSAVLYALMVIPGRFRAGKHPVAACLRLCHHRRAAGLLGRFAPHHPCRRPARRGAAGHCQHRPCLLPLFFLHPGAAGPVGLHLRLPRPSFGALLFGPLSQGTPDSSTACRRPAHPGRRRRGRRAGALCAAPPCRGPQAGRHKRAPVTLFSHILPASLARNAGPFSPLLPPQKAPHRPRSLCGKPNPTISSKELLSCLSIPLTTIP